MGDDYDVFEIVGVEGDWYWCVGDDRYIVDVFDCVSGFGVDWVGCDCVGVVWVVCFRGDEGMVWGVELEYELVLFVWVYDD